MAVDEEEDDAVYCICRSSDISRFMIGCDKCDEWYHGDCISVSAEDASVIKKYYCNRCRNTHPGLKIKYKRKYREQFQLTKPEKLPSNLSSTKSSVSPTSAQKVPEKQSSLNEVKRGQEVKTEKPAVKIDVPARNDAKDIVKHADRVSAPKSGATESSVTSSKHDDSHKDAHKDSAKKILPKTQTSLSIQKEAKERKLKPDDAILKDKAFKLGKSDAEKNLEKLLQGEIMKTANKLKEDKSKSISSQSSSADVKHTSPPIAIKSDRDANMSSLGSTSNDGFKVSTPQKDKMCVSKTEISPTGMKVVTIETKPGLNSSVSPQDNLKQPGCRPSITIMMDEDKDINMEESTGNVFGNSVLSTNTEDNAANDTEGYYHRRKKKRKYMDAMNDGMDGERGSGTQWTRSSTQCFGPGCQKISRRNSKYCSDECGMALARQRLLMLLPEKISEWRKKPPVATEKDRQELEKIRLQKAAVLSRVKELDIERQNLEREISLARRLEPLPEDDSDTEEGSSTNDIFCFTCGHQVNSSTALKHIERCFSKIETQTSYESKYPSNIPMLFCDAYNNRTKSFCKRLKIICPEHSAKDYKVGDDEVCGCPLPNPGEVIFNDKVPHEYCRVLKRRCLKHYKWEIMRIATIDAERVNSLIKYDELLESESKVESGIKTRGSVLDLLLNSCEAH